MKFHRNILIFVVDKVIHTIRATGTDSQLYLAQSTVPNFSLIVLSNSTKLYKKVLIGIYLLNILIEFRRNILILVVDMAMRTFRALDTESTAWSSQMYGA